MTLSLGGNTNNQWGIGRNGGVVWNGSGPAPTGAGAQAGISSLLSGSVAAGKTAVPQADGTYQLTGKSTWSPQPTGVIQPGAAQPGAAQYGLSGFENSINGALSGAVGRLDQSMAGARGDIQNYTNQAVGALQGYAQGGQSASQLQADLSGANGPEAQAAAFANFQSSPEQAYMREMGQKGILQNASALGGLHGSNVMQELQRHGVGLAAQDYGNYFNRLNDPANRGIGAAGQISSAYGNAGNSMAGITMNGGNSIADMTMRAGEGIAATRYDTGNKLSSNIANTTNSLASLTAEQGQQIADMIGVNSSNLASLLTKAADAQGVSSAQLAQILANIAQTSSGQAAGLPVAPGVQELGGQLSNVGNFLGGVGSVIKPTS